LDQLKSRYRLEILEYDTTGKHLDDTVFYVRYAQEIRELIGESEENFLLSFLADTNHIAQELMDRGNDPRKVFESVLLTGKTMLATTDKGFYADVQKFRITDHITLFCFQMPCGGNIFLISAPGDKILIDTGYGIYHHDVMRMLSQCGLRDERQVSKIIVTHADADHCGAAGYFTAPVFMHEGTRAIIRKNNRAYGSRSEHSVLEEFYTKMINLFSKFNSPKRIEYFSKKAITMRGIFPVIGTVSIGELELEVLEGLGGHTYGQIYLYSKKDGLLFTADSVINFSSLTKERADYSSLAAFLVTSVNVDSDLAKKESGRTTAVLRTGLRTLHAYVWAAAPILAIRAEAGHGIVKLSVYKPASFKNPRAENRLGGVV
jgi:glyoxylase-like metal-dependent hydrolase (beta-lactamase superfamily II)